MKILLLAILLSATIIPAFSESLITFDVDTTKFTPGEIVELKGTVDAGLEGQPVAVEIKDAEGNVILIRTITSDINGEFTLKFKVPLTAKAGEFDIVTNIELEGQSFSETTSVESVKAEPTPELASEPTPELASEPNCGTGTILKDGQCIVDTSKSSKGGGCLIATATYGSELAPEVQKLREIRDNSLLTTTSGTNFMSTFNDFYYSFSPIIADYERENPIFKEMVKIAITPMITSLSLMEYADSESDVLGIGISLIMLNVMMYVGMPIAGIIVIRNRF